MNLDQDGVNKLIFREGLRLKAYQDTKGIWTIGVGDIDINNDGVRDVYKGQTLTEQEAMKNFEADCRWAIDCVNTNVKVPITQNMFNALVSFVFNIGATAFRYSTVLRMLNRKDYEGAAKAFDMWHIPKSIIKRRDGEREQFLNGYKKEIQI